MKTIFRLLAVGYLVVALVGCATVQTNPTQTEQERARVIGAKVANAIGTTASILRAVQDTEISFHQAGRITDAEHKRIQSAFLVSFQALDVALTQLQSLTRVADLAGTIKAVEQGLSDLSAALAVAHPETAKHLQTVATAIGLTFAVIQSLIGV